MTSASRSSGRLRGPLSRSSSPPCLASLPPAWRGMRGPLRPLPPPLTALRVQMFFSSSILNLQVAERQGRCRQDCSPLAMEFTIRAAATSLSQRSWCRKCNLPTASEVPAAQWLLRRAAALLRPQQLQRPMPKRRQRAWLQHWRPLVGARRPANAPLHVCLQAQVLRSLLATASRGRPRCAASLQVRVLMGIAESRLERAQLCICILWCFWRDLSSLRDAGLALRSRAYASPACLLCSHR